MDNTKKRYVAADSYSRGDANYQKIRSRWYRMHFAASIGFFTGIGLGVSALLFHPFLPFIVIQTAVIIGGVLVVLAAPIWLISLAVILWRKLDDYLHFIAVHFMKEMGIPKPADVLHDNPQYLKSFEEVRTAVTAEEAALNGKRFGSQELTPRSRRIGSLVLRDEHSLAHTPYLLSLIKDQKNLDYDSLAELLDDRITA